jgi:iron complex outermembrane receptor protein
VVVSGNPHMRPMIVYNFEANYDRALPMLASILRTAVFFQRNENMLSQPLSNPPVIGPTGLPLILAGNIGRSDAVGTEIGIRGHSISGYRWNLSYSFVATTDHTTANKPANPVDYARSVPRHVVIAGIGYGIGRMELDLTGRWQSAYRDFRATGEGFVLQPVEVRNYLALNARVGYRLTDTMTMAISAQQFNVSRLMQTAGPAVERRVIVSLRIQL